MANESQASKTLKDFLVEDLVRELKSRGFVVALFGEGDLDEIAYQRRLYDCAVIPMEEVDKLLRRKADAIEVAMYLAGCELAEKYISGELK